MSIFNCTCVNRGQTSNQIVRYVDLSAIVYEKWGVFVGLFDKWNGYAETVSPAIRPLYSTNPNEIVISYDDMEPNELKNRFFSDSDPCVGMDKFFEIYGPEYPGQEFSHFSIYWPEASFPSYELQSIDEYWVSGVQGGNDLFSYAAFANLVELGFVGWNVSKPLESFQNAPSTLQLMELGSGYSYVMRDPKGIRFVCTCNAEDQVEYRNWYDAPSNTYTLTFLDDGYQDWEKQQVFFYDNAPHILETGDNIWRTQIPDMQSIIEQSTGSGIIAPDIEYYLSGCGCTDLNYPDMFKLSQGHPFHSVPSEAKYSNLYVPYIYDMFSHILSRNYKTWPTVRVEGCESIVIPLGTNEYYEPTMHQQPIAYTLCIFRLGGTEPEIIKTTANKEFLAAITTWDYKQTAVRQNSATGMWELWFSANAEFCTGYSSVYTGNYQAIWEEVANAVHDLENSYDLCYSLYIQTGHADTDIENTLGFECTEYNNEAFPSTFRIDFNWNFRSAIFYATWKHPFDDIRFG